MMDEMWIPDHSINELDTTYLMDEVWVVHSFCILFGFVASLGKTSLRTSPLLRRAKATSLVRFSLVNMTFSGDNLVISALASVRRAMAWTVDASLILRSLVIKNLALFYNTGGCSAEQSDYGQWVSQQSDNYRDVTAPSACSPSRPPDSERLVSTMRRPRRLPDAMP